MQHLVSSCAASTATQPGDIGQFESRRLPQVLLHQGQLLLLLQQAEPPFPRAAGLAVS